MVTRLILAQKSIGSSPIGETKLQPIWVSLAGSQSEWQKMKAPRVVEEPGLSRMFWEHQHVSSNLTYSTI